MVSAPVPLELIQVLPSEACVQKSLIDQSGLLVLLEKALPRKTPFRKFCVITEDSGVLGKLTRMTAMRWAPNGVQLAVAPLDTSVLDSATILLLERTPLAAITSLHLEPATTGEAE